MEVLNHNQRQSAQLRIIAMTAVTILLILLVLYSTSNKYTSQGKAEMAKMEKECNRDRKKSLKVIAGLQDDVSSLTKELEKCEDNIMNNKLRNCLDRLEKKEDTKEELKEELKECEKNYRAATSF